MTFPAWKVRLRGQPSGYQEMGDSPVDPRVQARETASYSPKPAEADNVTQ